MQGPAQLQGAKPKGVFVDGEAVVPAVVVFGTGDKNQLKGVLQGLSPGAALAVCSVHRITKGTPRYELHCKQSNVGVVLTFVDLLSRQGWSVAAYSEQRGAVGHVPKAQQASLGLAGANMGAGICKYFQNRETCPHLTNRGWCFFHCWSGPAGTGRPARGGGGGRP